MSDTELNDWSNDGGDVAKRGHIVAGTLCPTMLPVRGKNVATLLRAAMQTQEIFLKIFRDIFCVQDRKLVSAPNVPRVAKRGHIWET